MKTLKITEDLTMIDEGHVGGFLLQKDPATFMPRLWEYICKNNNIQSVVDVGCGMGYAIEEFKKHALEVIGVDGSDYIKTHSPLKDIIIYHDYTKGPLKLEKKYDLCWSSEFVEHVEEKFIHNFLETFASSKFLAITYAGVGQEGHHHVNCQDQEYWIETLKQYGFEYDSEETKNLKKIAYKDAQIINPLYNDNHFYNRGLFFKKQ